MAQSHTAKSAELQIIIWFLESGWELFTPVADVGCDLVVRLPQTCELLAVQVKHKEPGAKNEGWLENDWRSPREAPFDYLVFFVPARLRILIIPRETLTKTGKVFTFFKKDAEGYPRGPVRPLFAPYFLDLSVSPSTDRARVFSEFFARVHASRRSPPLTPE